MKESWGIFLFTILAYGVVYLYKASYLSYFCIPSEMTNVLLSDFIRFGFMFFSFILGMILVPIIYEKFQETDGKKKTSQQDINSSSIGIGIIIFILLFLISVSHAYGIDSALGKKEFMSIRKDNNQSYLLIDKINDTNGIFLLYDKNKNTISKEIYIKSFSDKTLYIQSISEMKNCKDMEYWVSRQIVHRYNEDKKFGKRVSEGYSYFVKLLDVLTSSSKK